MTPAQAAAARRRRTSRPRAPVLLLWLLLVNTLGVCVLSWIALRGQSAEIAAHRREAGAHALATLGAQIEHAVYQAVQEPMLLLRGAPVPVLDAPTLDAVRSHQEELRLVLVLGSDFHVLRDSPAVEQGQRDFITAAVEERVLGAAMDGHRARVALHAFADSDAEPPMLYTFMPIDPAGAPVRGDAIQGWLVCGFDMSRLEARVIQPLLEGHARTLGTRPVLALAGEDGGPSWISATLGGLLAPWELRVSAPGPGTDTLADLGPATIAVSIGLALAVALVSVAIVGAVRREHALAELRNRFVANVSHELKTPLSLIRMYAETLYLGRLRDPAKQQEYLRVLLGEAERLSRMIGDVLDFARLREGAAMYRLTETDLQASVSEALRSYLPEWTARGAHVREEFADDIPAVAHDAHGVVQLLLNLVDNAIKYAGEEPCITIRLVADRDRAVLEVIDDGPGIDAAMLTRLWRALQRGEAAPEAEGSGLGLALVKHIADAHHASFVLDSGVDGRGVRAQISFPHYTGTS